MKSRDRIGKEILDHSKFYKDLGVKITSATTKQLDAGKHGRKDDDPDPKSYKKAELKSEFNPEVYGKHSTLFDEVTDASETLDVIREDLGDCRRCKLCSGRQNIVFGSGNPSADLMFVGEAPGADEDRQGLPFVGRAGQLLTKIIEAIEMRREDVYICNILKCRPPGNRNPENEEIQACEPFLHRQIRSISPKVICALGTFGAQTLLKTKEPISRLRGHFIEFRGAKLLATYHPAYLLRNPSAKRKVWDDVRKIRDYLSSQH